MSPLPIWLLLSVATGLAYARLTPGVSRAYGLLTGCACAVAVAALMFFRADALLWAEPNSEFILPWPLPFSLITVAIGVAGSSATAGICRLRRAGVLPPEPPVRQS